MADQTMTSDQFAEANLSDWEAFLGKARARYATGDFVTGAKFVQQVTELAEMANHHPDVALRYGAVDLTLTSHDVGGLTQRDVDLARDISDAAAKLGLEAVPDQVTEVEWALDTTDMDEVKPFWAAVLGLDVSSSSDGDDLVDPGGAIGTLWFQQADPHEQGPQRWHPDIWVPISVVDARVEAAKAAGGTVLHVQGERRFTVLADPQGNRVCVCTRAGRSN